MGCFPGFLSDHFVGNFGDAVVRLPKIRVAQTVQIPTWQLSPQPFARLLRAVADEKGQDLPVSTVEDYPNSDLVDFGLHEGENLIYLHHVTFLGFLDGAFERG